MLRQRLAEMEETLRAIRAGEIDAIVVDGEKSPAIYTLKNAADPYRLIVEQMSEGALSISSDGLILYCNAAFARMMNEDRERLVGTRMQDLIIDSPKWPLPASNGFAQELRLQTSSGGVVHAHVSSGPPLLIDGLPIFCMVVTDLSRQELRVLHDAVVNASGDAIYALELDGTIKSWNPAAERTFGYPAQEARGQNIRMLVPPDKIAELQSVLSSLARGGNFELETVRNTKAGVAIEVALSMSAIADSQGAVSGVAVVARDITERKRTEKQIALLMGEVNHRAKNLLTVVQAIARQTARDRVAKEFTDLLNKRIGALAASHDLLVQTGWHGIDFLELVRAQLAYHKDLIDTRILVSGPALRIKPAAAQAIGMCLHELATNAAKYGALSNASGQVRIAWNLSGSDLQIRWSEHGGPSTKAPAHRGFGHTVIVQMAANALDGQVRLEFPESGVIWDAVAPVSSIVESSLDEASAQ